MNRLNWYCVTLTKPNGSTELQEITQGRNLDTVMQWAADRMKARQKSNKRWDSVKLIVELHERQEL